MLFEAMTQTQTESIAHLTRPMQRFYRRLTRSYQLLDHHRSILVAALEAHDRMEQAQAALLRDGLTLKTRHGEIRAHPCAAIERDSRLAFWRGLRELGLADEAESPRPPRLSGRYAGRT
jgi:P27 family predicted phage terminase small subunit